MPDPTRTVHLGQFRLTRLQIVNWGTFCGYKDFPLDERGVLFTGPSGSGKSSLMDAHSAVLLPTHDQRFNASADLTARGAKQSARSLADYVRGAWAESNDEHQQSQVQYLRGDKPTWSAIAATYDDGLGNVTTAVVVKWFTGLETDASSLKPMYQLHNGQFELTTLQTWAEKGFDTRWLRAAHPAYYPESQTAYMRDLAKRIGLGTSKTALSLLGKAKAMKNVGDLNWFIRTNMLDDPPTFESAKKMLETFKPLNEAYETAERANAQAEVLQEVPTNWAKYQESDQIRSRAAALLGSPVEHYLRGVHLQVLEQELQQVDEVIKNLDGTLAEQDHIKDAAQQTFLSLDRQLHEEGQTLKQLQAQLEATYADTKRQKETYRSYSGLVTRLQLACPQDKDAFDTLRQQLPEIGDRARSEKEHVEGQRHAAFEAAADVSRQHREKAEELTELRSAKSLIPSKPVARRNDITRRTGVPVVELPYVAELVDVAAGHERWRPAAEKVLRNYGMRLLVPEEHKDTIQRFIDQHDMAGLVEYSIVTATPTHRPEPVENTLAAKLTVDTDHPSGTWLAAQLTTKFDHTCVETASELDDHRIAVTVHGTVKQPGNHYRKDDRPELTNPSSYILGANTATKRAALEGEVNELATAKQKADAEACELDESYRNLESTIDAATKLLGYSDWIQLDYWASAHDAQQLAERIEDIKANNVNLQRLQRQRDDAEKQWERASDDCSKTRTDIEDYGRKQQQLISTYEDEHHKPHTISDDDDRAYLNEVFTDLEFTASSATMNHVRTAVRKELDQRRKTAEQDRRFAHSKLESAIGRFVEKWPDSAPDTIGEVDRCGADFAALHDEIVQRRLPEAMARLQQMISEDMVPSVSMLQRSIEAATKDIQRRVRMVNDGLRRVEFNTSTHLQITYKANPSDDVAEFRKQVDDLQRHAPAARDNADKTVAQFRRVRTLMARFTNDDAASRQWQTNVLDVRNSYTFYGLEEDADGVTVHTYRNAASNSGGEQEKLVAFCLAAALSYNLATPDSDGRPVFAPLMLDEAFSKSDETFSAQALSAFDEFGFQLLIAAPIRMSGIVEPVIGQAVLVEKRSTSDGPHSHAASATFGQLATRRLAESDGDIRASA